MAWYDRLAHWVDRLIERTFGLHDVFERHFHALGLHGPYMRHLAKTRVVPALLIGTALLLALIAFALVRRSRARRRPVDPGAPAAPLSAAGARPPSR
jgi:hypothetical protein